MTPTLPETPTAPVADELDRTLHAALARLTAGIAPAAVIAPFMDWALHLAYAPGRRQQLALEGLDAARRYAVYAAAAAWAPRTPPPLAEPAPQDRRFAAPAWQDWPFNVISQGFLLTEQWWQHAATGLHGVTRHHESAVDFTIRQVLDMLAPSNVPWLNPEVIARTRETGGLNLLNGLLNLCADAGRQALDAHAAARAADAQAYVPGRDVAVTPGQVVYRNHLIELIQYAPTRKTVRPQPILIVPAWIMKYYILDLSPGNSLVRHLVDSGHTVFMISWRNPDAGDRDLSMEDYRQLGIMAALEAINAIVPRQKVHAAGYCLGGTLLAIAAAQMARDGDERLASATFFAAQTDFTEPGELMLFINDSEIALLEDMMWARGYLDAAQMAGAFQVLRSNDLIWSRMIRRYLLGEQEPASDLMAWNADATRMPYRMHAEYLRKLFLDNDLAEGRLQAGGKRVLLGDLRLPLFAVGTEKDHVAPWRSVYKLGYQAPAEFTFLLTSGGHNAGIVSEPGHPGRRYRLHTRAAGQVHLDDQAWLGAADAREGSWWPAWTAWLDARSGRPAAPPAMGCRDYPPIEPAPGGYVHQA